MHQFGVAQLMVYVTDPCRMAERINIEGIFRDFDPTFPYYYVFHDGEFYGCVDDDRSVKVFRCGNLALKRGGLSTYDKQNLAIRKTCNKHVSTVNKFPYCYNIDSFNNHIYALVNSCHCSVLYCIDPTDGRTTVVNPHFTRFHFRDDTKTLVTQRPDGLRTAARWHLLQVIPIPRKRPWSKFSASVGCDHMHLRGTGTGNHRGKARYL